MNLYIQIRDVVNIIMEKSHLSIPDAMGKILSLKKLQKPCKIQKILFGRNLLVILQTAITKNKKKLKNNKTRFKKELLTKISGSFFM